MLIYSSVFTGSNNVSSLGIPAIESEWLNLKDVYVSDVSTVNWQLKSAWASPPEVGFTSLSRVQVASLLVESKVPSTNIKYKYIVIE